jgi:hypothetical protein
MLSEQSQQTVSAIISSSSFFFYNGPAKLSARAGGVN